MNRQRVVEINESIIGGSVSISMDEGEELAQFLESLIKKGSSNPQTEREIIACCNALLSLVVARHPAATMVLQLMPELPETVTQAMAIGYALRMEEEVEHE